MTIGKVLRTTAATAGVAAGILVAPRMVADLRWRFLMRSQPREDHAVRAEPRLRDVRVTPIDVQRTAQSALAPNVDPLMISRTG